MSEKLLEKPQPIELSPSDVARLDQLEATLINRENIESMRQHLREMDSRGWLDGSTAAETEEAEVNAVSSVFEGMTELKEFEGLLPDPDREEPGYDKAAARIFATAESLMYKTDQEVEQFFGDKEGEPEPDTPATPVSRVRRTVVSRSRTKLDSDPDSDPDEEPESRDEEQERVRNERILELEKDIDRLIRETAEAKKNGEHTKYASFIRELSRAIDEFGELRELTDEQKEKLWARAVDQIDKKSHVDPAPDAPDTVDAPKSLDELKSPELLQLEGRLREARDNLATLNVKVSGKIIKGKQLKESLEAAQTNWRKLQAEVGIKAIEFARELGMDLSDKEALKLFAVQGALAESRQLAAKEAELAIEGAGGNKLQRAWKAYVKAYNNGGKVKKAFLLAPVGLIAGVAAGTIVGAAGGGVFAGLVAKGAIRGAVTGKIRAATSSGNNEVDESTLNSIHVPNFYDSSADETAEQLSRNVARVNTESAKSRVDKEVRKNKKKMIGAVALGASVGAVAGTLTNLALDHNPLSGRGALHEKLPGGGGSNQVEPTPSNPAPVEMAPAPSINPIEYAGSKGVDLGASDAWPFKVASGLGLGEQDSIELARQNGFSFEGGKYWINGRMMNAEEMKWHNLGLAEIAAKRAAGL